MINLVEVRQRLETEFQKHSCPKTYEDSPLTPVFKELVDHASELGPQEIDRALRRQQRPALRSNPKGNKPDRRRHIRLLRRMWRRHLKSGFKPTRRLKPVSHVARSWNESSKEPAYEQAPSDATSLF